MSVFVLWLVAGIHCSWFGVLVLVFLGFSWKLLTAGLADGIELRIYASAFLPESGRTRSWQCGLVMYLLFLFVFCRGGGNIHWRFLVVVFLVFRFADHVLVLFRAVIAVLVGFSSFSGHGGSLSLVSGRLLSMCDLIRSSRVSVFLYYLSYLWFVKSFSLFSAFRRMGCSK